MQCQVRLWAIRINLMLPCSLIWSRLITQKKNREKTGWLNMQFSIQKLEMSCELGVKYYYCHWAVFMQIVVSYHYMYKSEHDYGNQQKHNETLYQEKQGSVARSDPLPYFFPGIRYLLNLYNNCIPSLIISLLWGFITSTHCSQTRSKYPLYLQSVPSFTE